MKAKLIAINWGLSFMGLCFVSPYWAQMVGAFWFIASTALFSYADKKGWMENIVKQYKLDEL